MGRLDGLLGAAGVIAGSDGTSITVVFDGGAGTVPCWAGAVAGADSCGTGLGGACVPGAGADPGDPGVIGETTDGANAGGAVVAGG